MGDWSLSIKRVPGGEWQATFHRRPVYVSAFGPTIQEAICCAVCALANPPGITVHDIADLSTAATANPDHEVSLREGSNAVAVVPSSDEVICAECETPYVIERCPGCGAVDAA